MPVQIARDRHGTTLSVCLAGLDTGSIEAALGPHIAPDAVLVTDGKYAYRDLAKAHGLMHEVLIAKAGERLRGQYHIQNVNAYISRLRQWIARFNGVATSYLDSYLAWYKMIDQIGEALTPTRQIGEAIGYSST